MKYVIIAAILITFNSFGATRGVRNNNPGNIVAGDKWIGRVGTDGRFVKFKSPEYGIRALIIVLRTYDKKYDINTISGIITRWSPPHENQTNKYINFVNKKTGIKSNQKLVLFEDNKVKDITALRKIVTAIIAYENKNYRYPNITIDTAIKLVGVASNPR
jgi:hypothetical protein